MVEAKDIDAEAATAAAPGYVRSKVQEPENDFGKRLQRMREDLDISQEQLSVQTLAHDASGKGISRAVISMYERGRNKPSPRELRILCDTMRVTPNQLLYGDDSPFETDRWTVLGQHSPPEHYARWVYLYSELDSVAKLALFDLVISIKRPSKAFFDRFDTEAVAKFLALAEELKKTHPQA